MGLIGRIEDQQRGKDAISQADDGVANFAFFVETGDFQVKVRARPAWRD